MYCCNNYVDYKENPAFQLVEVSVAASEQNHETFFLFHHGCFKKLAGVEFSKLYPYCTENWSEYRVCIDANTWEDFSGIKI